ncbi:hypothetical protein [Actinosynnema mirum]|uniref:Hemaglutinin domain protein n=1 Tax=Actinosynnema mirum (strain ATCC 29888 / DSM 43827 / JCM 3225 / NBRC 14064 / NCIMB 13271 / NRRL B-12336 / IMRU 3971 / 101) TaxID=446462 RepID=C6WBF5_ACTMD|nr:hypothetical protein [Actinosynnema mirum]ACU35523.1 hemaglutinin domain protein [Actinosynnema mirum DSM 43827]
MVQQFPSNGSRSPRVGLWVAGVVGALIVLGLVANGRGGDTGAEGGVAERSSAAPVQLTSVGASATSVGASATSVGAAAVSVAEPAPLPEPSPVETCVVPDVVGVVHQTAQDTMQAAGLYLLHEEDATGQGRLLLYDRNWVTTAQSVPAGQVVDCSTAITLSAKKIGE